MNVVARRLLLATAGISLFSRAKGLPLPATFLVSSGNDVLPDQASLASVPSFNDEDVSLQALQGVGKLAIGGHRGRITDGRARQGAVRKRWTL